ncbi:MAG TPA: phosphoribosylglycinamide formyltransferase [Burkholderiales bacterium]|nr:phosphoribosylglycinamide formyltransferase [Betaproteobacteria bacterium]HQR51939.1 phosphoribosylglycinamide formyltransferase [Burkholderiales bacterium]
MRRLVILISGRGSNMEALLKAELPASVVAVISNRGDAAGLDVATNHDVPTRVVEHREFASRDAFDAALAEVIDGYAPDYVLLAGFMRVLSAAFVARFAGRLINIHPSLLPAFPGLHTHARALAEGVKVHGCTVHFVTPALDHGPIIIQAAVPVRADDTEDTLAARVLEQEHRVFPQAVRWLCEERVSVDAGGRVVLAGGERVTGALVVPPVDA